MSDRKPRFQAYVGAAIADGAPAFQVLHSDVFWDWPYLYAADPTATPYISRYAALPRAALFLGFDDAAPVAAATCLPLADESESVRAPFEARGWDLGRFFYFGEGIVRADWRGRGLGKRIFELREAHARAHSAADFTCFCSVRRPAGHAMRPDDAITNDAFWRSRGYAPLPDMACTMRWTDRGEDEPSDHLLDFWYKSLTGAALP